MWCNDVADRGAIPTPVRDGSRQRDAGLVLRRRRQPRARAAAASRLGGCCDEGAAIVDVGGESTRPGLRRSRRRRGAAPGRARARGAARRAPISIDTAKAEVARARARPGGGARQRRDGAARRSRAGRVVAECGAYLCLMHMQGEPRTMQADPSYDDVARRSRPSSRSGSRFAVDAGIAEEPHLPRPGHRLRQDGGAELRARPAARRADRARPARS